MEIAQLEQGVRKQPAGADRPKFPCIVFHETAGEVRVNDADELAARLEMGYQTSPVKHPHADDDHRKLFLTREELKKKKAEKKEPKA